MTMPVKQREPVGGKENSSMARKKKRQYGSGEVLKRGAGLAIRWREPLLEPDGRIKYRRRYEALGPVSQKEAARRLAEKLVESGSAREPVPTVTFREHAARWIRDILPMHKFSVRNNYRMTLEKHLIPRFGDALVSAGNSEAARFLITVPMVQSFITEAKEHPYAPYTVHYFHEVLRAVLKSAVEWYRSLDSNPAEGVKLPKLVCKIKPWALSPVQAGRLLAMLKDKPRARAAVWLLIVTGIRRGEYLAIRWQNVDEQRAVLKVTEAFYRGHLDTPKTEASVREVALDSTALQLLRDWKAKSPRTARTDLIFGTRSGKPDRPENLLYKHVFPACDELKIPRATFLTFRRTFSTLSHYNGTPAKDIAESMGHAEVDTQFIYIQTVGEAKKAGAEKIGTQLATNGHIFNEAVDYVE
jgi:integrase